MTRDANGEARQVRERPPAWPGRQRLVRQRGNNQPWLREHEPYEDAAIREPYVGATLLEDMAEPVDPTTTLHVLARYTVFRILVLTAAGRMRGPKLRTEQRVAAGHLALLPSSDWERHTLERLAASCEDPIEPVSLDLARSCADSAAERGHNMGAFALYRAGYEIALARQWWEDAAFAARGIWQLAARENAPVSVRVWRWRTRVLNARHQLRQAALQRAMLHRAAPGSPEEPTTAEPGEPPIMLHPVPPPDGQ